MIKDTVYLLNPKIFAMILSITFWIYIWFIPFLCLFVNLPFGFFSLKFPLLYNNSTDRSCSSSLQWWKATRGISLLLILIDNLRRVDGRVRDAAELAVTETKTMSLPLSSAGSRTAVQKVGGSGCSVGPPPNEPISHARALRRRRRGQVSLATAFQNKSQIYSRFLLQIVFFSSGFIWLLV